MVWAVGVSLTLYLGIASMGIHTGIDLDALIDAGEMISNYLERPNSSRVARAILNRRAMLAESAAKA